jgi:hypothetical protein
MATTLGETAFAVAVQSGAVPLAWMTGAAAGGLFEVCEAAVVVAVVPAVARATAYVPPEASPADSRATTTRSPTRRFSRGGFGAMNVGVVVVVGVGSGARDRRVCRVPRGRVQRAGGRCGSADCA